MFGNLRLNAKFRKTIARVVLFVLWIAQAGAAGAVAAPLPVKLSPKTDASHSGSSPDVQAVQGDAAMSARERLALAERFPLAFEKNFGQADPRVLFQARGRGYGVFVTSDETVLSVAVPGQAGAARENLAEARDGAAGLVPDLQAHEQRSIRIRFAGAPGAPEITGENPLPGKVNYFKGNDASKWVTDVPTFEQVRSRNVYPGIDVVHYGNQGELEYDMVVSPGADPSAIQLDIEGADAIREDESGNLVLEIGDRSIHQKPPVVYQMIDGVRKPVAGSYVVRGDGMVGFRVGSYDESQALVIDPVLVYARYLGGGSVPAANTQDEIFDVATDASGNIYVVGWTNSSDYPTTAGGASIANQGGFDVVVSKFNSTATTLIYSTFLGGSGNERGFGVTVDSAGNAYVYGDTTTPTTNVPFPTTAGAFQQAHAGIVDVFVTKLNPAGTALVYSTLIGGSGVDRILSSEPGGLTTGQGTTITGGGIEVDPTGAVYITGETAVAAIPFPTTSGAYDQIHNDAEDIDPNDPNDTDAFITKLNPAGTDLVFSTFIGGSARDQGNNLDILEWPAGSGNYDVFVAGATLSANFPSVPVANTNGQQEDGFTVRLDSAGAILLYSRSIAGGGSNVSDYCVGVAVDSMGFAYYAGHTTSNVFWTTIMNGVTPPEPAYQVSHFNAMPGYYDAFILKLNPDGSVNTCTLFGREQSEQVLSDIEINASGEVYLTLRTNGTNGTSPDPLTTAGAFDTTFADTIGQETNWDIVFAKFNSTLSQRLYATYLGDAGNDGGRGLTVLPDGDALVVGVTNAPMFPVANAFDATYAGGTDGFLLKLSPDGNGTSDLVFSTFLNGSKGQNLNEAGNTVDVGGPDNAIYVAGYTGALDFPVTSPLDGTLGGNLDAFVTKLSSNGASVVYSTYIGGSSDDYASFAASGGRGLAVGPDGAVYLAGITASSDFPHPGFPNYGGGAFDGFVLKLNPGGNALEFSRFIGGVNTDSLGAIALEKNPSGEPKIHVIGTSKSSGLPFTANAFQNAPTNAEEEVIVVRLLNADPVKGAIDYLSYYGGSSFDAGYDIDVDTAGRIYFCVASSSSLIIPNGYDTSWNGVTDTIVARFTVGPTSTAIQSTWLGGTADDRPYFGLRVDNSDNVYVAGFTQNTGAAFFNYPTPANVNGYDHTHNGGYDLFVTKLNSDLNTLLYSTVLGSIRDEFGGGSIDVDTTGNVYLCATTTGPNFPVTSAAADPSFGGTSDVVLCKIDTTVDGASSLKYSSFLGGVGSDQGFAAAVDNTGRMYATGLTTSSGISTDGSQLAGSQDAFIAYFRICPNVASVATTPANGAIYTGATATLTATATGDSALTYLWRERLPDMSTPPAPGVNDQPSYTTPVLTSDRTYFVEVTGTCNTTASTVASPYVTVTVCTPPAITGPVTATPPEAITTGVLGGTQVTLTVPATGTGLMYQWYLGETGDTSSPLGAPSPNPQFVFSANQTASYWVRVLGTCALPLAPADSPTVNVTVLRAPIEVTSLADSGAGSLRDAIVTANADPEPDGITFNFPGAGPYVVDLMSALPEIVYPVTINGYSQMGTTPGVPMIVLNGAAAGGTTVADCDVQDMDAGADGLHFGPDATGSIVRGLVIQNFTGDGIEFEGGGQNLVTGCYIGTTAAGTAAAANGRNGVYINGSAENRIGGDRFQGEGNLISGNTCSGILMRGGTSLSNVVEGCFVGTNANGFGRIANGVGIRIDGAPQNLVGSGDDAGRRCRVRGNTGGGVTNTNTGSSPQMTMGTIITGNSISDNGDGGAIVGGAGAVPTVTDATLNGNTLTVTGMVAVAPNTNYDVEYFRNTLCGATSGQGEEFLAKVRKRATSGVLDLGFAATSTKVRPGEYVAVTVTGPTGTSNFSLCQVVDGRLGISAQKTGAVNMLMLPDTTSPVFRASRSGMRQGVGENPMFGAAGPETYRESSGAATVNERGTAAPEMASPGLTAQFEGLDDNPAATYDPSDAQGAVGPTHAVSTTNLEIAVQNKTTGAFLKRVAIESFFDGLRLAGETTIQPFNPRITFDPYAPGGGRFIIAVTANENAANSAVLVAVSQEADPLGDWNLYRYEGDVSDVAWNDYPTLGFTKDWIAIHINMQSIGAPVDGVYQFVRGELYLLDKDSLYNETPGTGPGSLLGAVAFATAAPALTYSPTESTLWLMAAGRDAMTREGLVNVFKVTGPVGGEVLETAGTFVATGTAWSTDVPSRDDFAPQPGTTRHIQVNDARMHSVVYRNGRLWGAQTILLPAPDPSPAPEDPTLSAVQYWEIDPGPATPGIVQRGVVMDPMGEVFYAFPSVAVSATGNMVLGYSRFSGSSFAGAAYRYRTIGDPAGMLRDEVILRAGEAKYDRFPMLPRNRWGNYSAAVVDAGDDQTLWLLNMYAKQPDMGVDQWGTYWGGIGNVAGCQVTCPGNVTVNAEAGQCGAVVTYSAPTTAGDCQTVSCVPASGTTFGVGVTTVTCTNSGNGAQCSFTVTVVDAQAPTVTCPANVTVNAGAGQCSAVVAYTTPTASDNCAGATVACAPASGTTFTVGTTTVTCTATDASSNTTQCAFTVTVNDMEAPVIECPATLTAVAGAGACSAPVNFNLSVSDNCPGAISVETSHPLATAFPVGTTQVTVTATDVSGNSSTCQVMVTVTDVTAPVIGSCAANVTRQAESNAGAAVVYAAPAATDACGATVVCAPASGTTFSVGVTTVVCTATDGSSNAAQCTFTVTVEWPADSMGAVNGSGAWFLKDTNGQGGADAVFFFGLGTDASVVGDYDGDGRDTVGVYRPSTAEYFLKNANTQEAPVALAFQFGGPGFGFVPVMGDWDGNGTATVGFYSPSNGAFFIKNTNAGGDADLIFFFGGASQGRIPIVGDWDGDGRDGIGLYNPAIGSFELKNVVGNGVSDIVFFFGAGGQGYVPVVGDWDNDGRDGVALYSPTAGAYFLKNELTTTGVADRVFFYGPTNARPVAGNWDVRP